MSGIGRFIYITFISMCLISTPAFTGPREVDNSGPLDQLTKDYIYKKMEHDKIKAEINIVRDEQQDCIKLDKYMQKDCHAITKERIKELHKNVNGLQDELASIETQAKSHDPNWQPPETMDIITGHDEPLYD